MNKDKIVRAVSIKPKSDALGVGMEPSNEEKLLAWASDDIAAAVAEGAEAAALGSDVAIASKNEQAYVNLSDTVVGERTNRHRKPRMSQRIGGPTAAELGAMSRPFDADGSTTKKPRTSAKHRVARAKKIHDVLDAVDKRRVVLKQAYDNAGGLEGLVDRAVLVGESGGEPFKPAANFLTYYPIKVTHPLDPNRGPYVVDCLDIIEALGMSYAEGCMFKAIWHKCAVRQGVIRDGMTDGEKVAFFGQRVLGDEITPKGNR